jgi:hypothetical protein
LGLDKEMAIEAWGVNCPRDREFRDIVREVVQNPASPGGKSGRLRLRRQGNQTTAAITILEGSSRTSLLNYSAESRLSSLATSNGPSSTELLYDGRGFLYRSRLTATNTNDFEQTEPIYSSEGLLLARRYHKQVTRGGRGDEGSATTGTVQETAYLFYFAGRPVAQLPSLPGAVG